MEAAATALDRLADAVASGRVDTVRVCFADHYGVLRGRRVAAERFLADASAPQGFCDGALVWDVRCEIFEAAAFSNYATGYPDLYVHADLASLCECAWAPGEAAVLGDVRDAHGAPIALDPRGTLRRVAQRAAVPAVGAAFELNVPDERLAAGWTAGSPPPLATRYLDGLQRAGLEPLALTWDGPRRRMRLQLAERSPLALADAIALARGAARELAAEGVRLTPAARTAAGEPPARMTFSLATRDAAGALARLDDVRLLLAPLPLAYAPSGVSALGGALDRGAAATVRIVVHAASDANPYLALAAALAAVSADGAAGGAADPTSYRAAIDRFAAAGWVPDWLGDALVGDALTLARREADLRESAVTEWDLRRYWECG